MKFVISWEVVKELLASGSGLTHHELHLVLGLLLFLAFGILSQRPLWSFLPLVPVALLESFNEWSDYQWFLASRWTWHWQEAAFDAILTLGLPLAVIARAKLDHLMSQRRLQEA